MAKAIFCFFSLLPFAEANGNVTEANGNVTKANGNGAKANSNITFSEKNGLAKANGNLIKLFKIMNS